MEYGAIDLHKRRSQIRIVRADGSVSVDRKIDTTPTAGDARAVRCVAAPESRRGDGAASLLASQHARR